MRFVHAIGHALTVSGGMTWQILWSLILGFGLSAVVQALVRKGTIERLLGNDSPSTLVRATGLGIGSSSCSYAAVALARGLFRKGADFTAVMVFEIASTNLVIELGIIMALLLGWQFTAAEFVGGPIMIVCVAVLFRLLLRQRLVDGARRHADLGIAGSMEGHAAMDMTVRTQGVCGPASRRPRGSPRYPMSSSWSGLRCCATSSWGCSSPAPSAAWVPDSFWGHLFLTGHPLLAKIWGPLLGPLISVVAFVCSIGNVPLAAVLWNGGISFGGVISFIFADLIILPILVIYRKYYGTRMMLFILGTFYVTMVAAGYAVELIFGAAGLIPTDRAMRRCSTRRSAGTTRRTSTSSSSSWPGYCSGGSSVPGG